MFDSRFYHRAPNTVQEFVDSVENYIIQSPGKFASVDEVKKLFVTEKLSFKKMVQSSLFAKRIKVNVSFHI